MAAASQKYEILFLDAADEVLVKRYKETRRTHPLARGGRVDRGIAQEREKLAFLKRHADYIIDTSKLLTRELNMELEKIFVEGREFKSLVVTVLSFGFKYGIPADADLVFDVAIYEPKFKEFSFGFRPNRSCHDAIQRVNKHIMADKVNYILDADIKGFFDNLDHEWMIKFLEHDIADKNFIRYIKRFLIGGVMEDGKRLDTEAGTVQGGLISPVLANVYLHYTLDTWFDYVKKHEFKGEMYMVRYADDFVCLFQYENEAQRFYQLLIERLRKFGLEIAEDKSRILPFGRYKGTKESFDFLGFTHYNVTSHWGKYCVLHRTSRKKLKMKREAVKKWLWEHMHESIADTIEALNVKLTGHYRYYGIYGNYIGLQKYYKYVRQELWKSKRRRDQTYWLTWKKYMNILKIHPLEYPRIYLKSAY